MIAPRLRLAVAGEIESQLTLRRLQAAVDLAFGRAQRVPAAAAENLALRDVPQRLLQNAHTLPRLQQPDVVAVVDVAVGQRRNVKIEAVVDAVRLGLANVVRQPAGPDHRPAYAERNQIFDRQIADPAPARHQNLVLRQQPVQLIQRARQPLVREIGGLLMPAFRQIAHNAAKAHVVAHHARARHRFEQVQDHLPFFDRVQRRRLQRAQVVQNKPDRPGMIDDAAELRHDDAQILRPFRHLDIRQLLHRQRIGPVVAHRVQIVQPVCERHVHQPRIAFADLLMVAVQIAHFRLKRQDGLALHARQHPEHTVRARVMGSQIDHDALGIQVRLVLVLRGLAHRHIGHRLLPRVRIPSGGIGRVLGPRHLVLVEFVFALRMPAAERLGVLLVIGLVPVLAHRMPVEPVPEQNPPQIRVPVKLDAEQVVDLPLLQIRARVDRRRARHRVVLRHPHVQRDRTAAPPRAVEVVDDLEAGVDPGAQLAAVPLIVDTGQIGQEVIALPIAQMRQHLQNPVGRNHVRLLGILGPRVHHRIGQFRRKPQFTGRGIHYSSRFSHSTLSICP